MNLVRNPRSISTRLVRMNLLVSATALILACISFLIYDAVSFRRELSASIATEAQIIGSNTVSALLFNDQQTADSTLSALRNSHDVLRAEVFTSQGDLFASYVRDGTTAPAIQWRLRTGQQAASWSQGRYLLLGSLIVFKGQPVGSVYILADTHEASVRARNYVLIAFGILLFCLFAAFLVSRASRRELAMPLIRLANTARAFTRSRDYSIRATNTDPNEVDELSTLVHSFNEMLDEIERREIALQEAKQELERKVQERTAELKTANEGLEAFSYSVAHDLRGPLDEIGNLTYLLSESEERPPRSDGDRALLEQLQGGVERMSSLIEDLLNLARSTRGTLHTQRVDLSAIISEIASSLTASDPYRRVQFKIAPGITAEADQRLIRIVLENVLRNAWKYTSKVPIAKIDFGLLARGEDCIYFIRDNGAGFDPALADRLFKPFQRLHTEGEFPGTGVGLATVQRIIARHGGRVWAEGTLSRGATVFFTIGARNVHDTGRAVST